MKNLDGLNEVTSETVEDFPYEFITDGVSKLDDIDFDWVPFTNWLRFRFDNDGVIIITNTELGHSIFVNEITGLILSLCNGKYRIIEILQGIKSKYPDENEVVMLRDLLGVILDNYKIGNLVLMKPKETQR